jgi:uncharacterized membrane protein YeaQ/YmgE (transglycosylase-associated protein family)
VTLGFILALLLGGLIIGALARLALPGPDPIGIFATIGLGLAGSFLGGLIGQVLFGRPGGFLLALLASILLLYLYRRFVEKRPLTRQ